MLERTHKRAAAKRYNGVFDLCKRIHNEGAVRGVGFDDDMFPDDANTHTDTGRGDELDYESSYWVDVDDVDAVESHYESYEYGPEDLDSDPVQLYGHYRMGEEDVCSDDQKESYRQHMLREHGPYWNHPGVSWAELRSMSDSESDPCSHEESKHQNIVFHEPIRTRCRNDKERSSGRCIQRRLQGKGPNRTIVIYR